MTDKRTFARQAFDTEEPFKAVAARLKTSPNTLRVWWVEWFGKEAFDSRGKRIQSKAAAAVGHAKKGSTCKVREITESCSLCGSPIQVNLIQKARSKRLLCAKCSESERGVDRICPVCNQGCVGVKGLAMHLSQVDDVGHATYQALQEDGVWAGQKEGIDFVRCLVCGHRGARIDRHVASEHGLSTVEYRAKFPNAEVQSGNLKSARSESATRQHQESPRKGLTKVILCSNCDRELEVSAFFAYSTHDSRCPECKQADLDASDLSKWEGKSEPEDYVTCQVCGHRAENLTSHVSSEHRELVGRYESIHPNSKLIALSSKIHGPSVLRGRTLSDEVKAKMSASAGWNRGLTKETDARVANAAEAMKGRIPWSKGFTKESHPSLQSISEKLSQLRGPERYWSNGLKADLSKVDFTPFIDETGAVDRKSMSETLGISGVTITKYMEAIGLRISTKYVDARVERDIQSGRFFRMSQKSAEQTTIRLTPEQLEPYRLKNGKVMLGKAMTGLGHVYAVIKRECDRLEIPTHTWLVKQSICLDAIAKALGEVAYEAEWRSRKFMSSKGGFFRFDGYYPSHNLVCEFHGYQHYFFPSIYIQKEELYFALQERDRIKENLIHSDPTLRYFLVREDEPYADPEYLRGRLIDEGILAPGK